MAESIVNDGIYEEDNPEIIARSEAAHATAIEKHRQDWNLAKSGMLHHAKTQPMQ